VDRILFREIIGTVTDALYARPWLRWVLVESSTGRLSTELAVIGSRAVRASSTPGGHAPLGIEVDPSLSYETADGVSVIVDYALLWPLSGFDNRALGRSAKPAQALNARLSLSF
jgi:hypothetical protein